MSKIKQMKYSQSGVGRIILHLCALKRDGKWAFHFKGIGRELNRTPVST